MRTYQEEREIIGDVRKRYPNIEFPDVELIKPVYAKKMVIGEDDIPYPKEMMLEGQQAIFSNGNYVTTATEEYKLVAHELAIWEFERMMQDHPEFPIKNGMEIRFQGANQDVMYCSLTTPIAQQEVKVGDPVSVRAGFVNSIDKSKELTGYFDALRLVCKNGATASFMNKYISKKHRQCLDVEEHMQIIGENLELCSKQFDIWKNWSQLEMKKSVAQEILDELPIGAEEGRYRTALLETRETSTKKTLEEMLKSETVNAWDLNNVVTQFITHGIEKERARQIKQDNVSAILHRRFDGLIRASRN